VNREKESSHIIDIKEIAEILSQTAWIMWFFDESIQNYEESLHADREHESKQSQSKCLFEYFEKLTSQSFRVIFEET
jgi:hypothetical protein